MTTELNGMLDLRLVRDDPALVRERLGRRGDSRVSEIIDRLLAADEERRALITEVGALRSRRNEVSPMVGRLRKEGRAAEADALILEMRQVGDRIAEIESRLAVVEGEVRDHLLQLPNLPEPDVPPGDASANVVVREWGESPEFGFPPQSHLEIGERLGILDFPRGAKITGSGFPVLVGAGARLERALINFMIDMHAREHGYTEVWPPFLINREAALGTGHLPKFGEDMYDVPEDGLYLVPTAEVPITNLHAGELLHGADLPIRYVAYTPCFRREAGAHGRETRGLIRVHQFDKVEMVRFERPEDSGAALEELTTHAEEVLRRLGLRYRVLLLAGGDLGFANAKTYDLEVWAPGSDRWLEVSSCSLYGSFQARRANIRYRPAPGQSPEFVHTLNGSGLALARVMVALLECGQLPDGSVRLPASLVPYFGADHIPAP
ncbi:MAG TPA: serine--tRNA ligase [Longimicrobiales bacterium]|nr:serine--tRNA ligase [Longimicrobiales bacterium]